LAIPQVLFYEVPDQNASSKIMHKIMEQSSAVLNFQDEALLNLLRAIPQPRCRKFQMLLKTRSLLHQYYSPCLQ